MTDREALPPEDFVAELLRKADVLIPQYLATLEEAASNKGQKTIRIQCSSCGHGNTKSFTVTDPEQTRKNLETLTSLKLRLTAAQREQTSGAPDVMKLLSDMDALSREDLAAAIVRLEADLAYETTPVDRDLAAAIESLDQAQRAALLKTALKAAKQPAR